MADLKLVREWIDKADEDFGFASSVLPDTTYYAHLCFHFHQAAEKYLKAFIVAYDLEFKKVHDLLALLKICKKKEPAIAELTEECRFLNRFYIDTRYPVHWPSNYTFELAKKAEKAAQHIQKFVKRLLNFE